MIKDRVEGWRSFVLAISVFFAVVIVLAGAIVALFAVGVQIGYLSRKRVERERGTP
jgi:hypothetical protein